MNNLNKATKGIKHIARGLLLILAFATVACAKAKDPSCTLAGEPFVLFPDNTSQKTDAYTCSDGSTRYVATNTGETFPPFHDVCLMRWEPEQIRYSDGVIRKSDVFDCSNGCVKVRFVNDYRVQLNTCLN